MIIGLHVDISTAELEEHLKVRAEHHRQKAVFYGEKTEELRTGGLSTTGHSRDPLRDIQEHAAGHAAKAVRFAWIARHLVPEEVYRLTVHDLTQWEFVEDR